MSKYIAYIRVSTERQGRSGLGLEAQREIIKRNVGGENIVSWYEEVHTGKNLDNLPQLIIAKNKVKTEGYILVIAKTDRLRNTQQALDLVDELTPEGVFFCNVGRNADKFMLTLFFAFAEKERLEISIRTKAALAVLKAKGVKLGRYPNKKNKENREIRYKHMRNVSILGARARLLKSIKNTANLSASTIAIPLRSKGSTYKEIAEYLNAHGYRTPKNAEWRGSSVYVLIKRYLKFALPCK